MACLAAAGFCPVPTHASLPAPESPHEPEFCQVQPEHRLPVPLSPQEQSKWCWAASGQMVMNFLGATVKQCDEANKQFYRIDCCQSPVPLDCDKAGWPEPDEYDFNYRTTSNVALSWNEVQDEIYCNGRPFAFSWHYLGGGGHMMVAVGYHTVSGQNYLKINDPSPADTGTGTYWENTYEIFDAQPGHYTHWNDYYAFARRE
ncbi:C39 family peptidase [Sorangium sp. So ce145]|uniref:C39 family peptidase n=1 Tax=Sorangium sp. So ce145 TaxID=3133285 RepID=UPI003F5F8B8A